MGINFPRERVLRKFWWEEFEGCVGDISRVLLEKREDPIAGTSHDCWREEGVDDGRSLRRGCNEGCGTVLDSRTKACSTKFHWEKGLTLRSFVEVTAENKGESGELLVIEVLIGGEKVGSVAGPETIRELGEGVANF